MKRLVVVWCFLLAAGLARAESYLLVPMDLQQTQHLKAYGHAFHALQAGEKVSWLLNYRGGSFLLRETSRARLEAALMGVKYEIIDDAAVAAIRQTVA